MEYQDSLQAITSLEFIEEQEAADNATKAVLGMLASRLKEAEAKKLTENLPVPLSLANLRGHQIGITSIPAEGYVTRIAT